MRDLRSKLRSGESGQNYCDSRLSRTILLNNLHVPLPVAAFFFELPVVTVSFMNCYVHGLLSFHKLNIHSKLMTMIVKDIKLHSSVIQTAPMLEFAQLLCYPYDCCIADELLS